MTNDQKRRLALALLKADSEAEVIELLEAAGLWDKPGAWRLVGDRDGNFATIGSQQSRPEAALVEKIINSVDARLMNECLVRGIDPASEKAPPSIRHAVARFFENREPQGELGGKLQTWSQGKQLEQSQYITLAVTGAMPRSGDPCITIADCGEGQAPAMIPNTFLSIDRNNKLKILFVQGKFNMGRDRRAAVLRAEQPSARDHQAKSGDRCKARREGPHSEPMGFHCRAPRAARRRSRPGEELRLQLPRTGRGGI